MEVLLLGVIVVLSIMMIPFGLPGTWIIAASALGYRILVPTGGVGYFTVVALGVLAVVSAVIEMSLSASYAKKYGGSRRAGWGAVLGGMVGAFMGIPIPIVGSIVGAFAGAFVGAFVFEMRRGSGGGTSTRVAWGALIGRVTAAAIKIAIGLVMAVWLFFAALSKAF